MEKLNKPTLKLLKYIKNNPKADEYKINGKFRNSDRYLHKLEELNHIDLELIQDPRQINGYLMNTYSISDEGLFYIEHRKEEIASNRRKIVWEIAKMLLGALIGAALSKPFWEDIVPLIKALFVK